MNDGTTLLSRDSTIEEQRTIASVTYLSIFVTPFVLALAIWFAMFIRRTRRYAQFQAAQAMLYQLVVTNLIAALGLVGFIVGYQRFGINLLSESDFRRVLSGGSSSEQLMLAFVVFMGVVTIATYAYSVYAAVRAYQPEPFRIPVIANLAEMISPMPDIQQRETQR